jgi:hypothetical protein
MDLHGPRVDVWLERVERVGKGRNFVRHGVSFVAVKGIGMSSSRLAPATRRNRTSKSDGQDGGRQRSHEAASDQVRTEA